MEVLHIIQVKLSLILCHPGTQGVVNVSGLLPLLLLNLWGHVPSCDECDQNGEHSSHANSSDVAKEHGDLLSSILDKGGTRQASREGTGKGQPDRHASNSPSNNPTDSAIAGSTGPQNRDSNGHHRGGNEDASEVVSPGQVEVDSPAEKAKGNGEEGGEHNAPVLVVKEMFLVLLEILVDAAGVVGLDNCLTLCSDDCILLQ